MGKINCDVCGTAYPEAASQCPICGCVRAAEGSADSGDSGSRNGSYTYVKGGRFSKANVRKRNQGMPLGDMPPLQDADNGDLPVNNSKTDRGLVAAVCVLLLAIVAVVIYIITRFFSADTNEGSGSPNLNALQTTEATISTTVETESVEPTVIPTTEETVEPTVEETVEETVPETQPTQDYSNYVKPFKLNTEGRKNDVTIYLNGSFQLQLKDANGTVMDVKWVVTNPEICSVEGNTVTGIKTGKTTVEITIEDITYSCIVRVVR